MFHYSHQRKMSILEKKEFCKNFGRRLPRKSTEQTCLCEKFMKQKSIMKTWKNLCRSGGEWKAWLCFSSHAPKSGGAERSDCKQSFAWVCTVNFCFFWYRLSRNLHKVDGDTCQWAFCKQFFFAIVMAVAIRQSKLSRKLHKDIFRWRR